MFHLAAVSARPQQLSVPWISQGWFLYSSQFIRAQSSFHLKSYSFTIYESRNGKSHIGPDSCQRAHKYPTRPKGLITVSLLVNLDAVAQTWHRSGDYHFGILDITVKIIPVDDSKTRTRSVKTFSDLFAASGKRPSHPWIISTVQLIYSPVCTHTPYAAGTAVPTLDARDKIVLFIGLYIISYLHKEWWWRSSAGLQTHGKNGYELDIKESYFLRATVLKSRGSVGDTAHMSFCVILLRIQFLTFPTQVPLLSGLFFLLWLVFI